MENLKEKLQDNWRVIAIAFGIILILAGLYLVVSGFKDNDKNLQEEPNNTEESPVQELEEDDEALTSETDAIETAEDEEDALTDIGLPSIYMIQNDEVLKEDYTTFLTDVESLLNGLSVGYSVMDSVFADISTMGNAEALKQDFNTSVQEYQQIFELLQTAEVTDNTTKLRDTLLKAYVDMFEMRKLEAENLTDVGGTLIVDYAKVGHIQEEITEHYQKIIDIHTALTDATGVYIGDGVSN